MLEYIQFTGKIELLSGLGIGGNKDTIQIGGIDSPIIKNPISNMPYIPGSSLKGKIRFLLEHHYGLITDSEIPKLSASGKENWKLNKIAVIFGHLEHNEENITLPTRVIFRDCNIIGAKLNGVFIDDIDALKDRMMSDFSEAKTEVKIDRQSGTAIDGGLRIIERIPAGTIFDFSMVLKVFNQEEADDHKSIIIKGLKLLQQDSLGGSGSRGYGKIKFFDLKIAGEQIDLDSYELKK